MRYRRMLAPINTVKHYVQAENAVTATGARRSIAVVDAIQAPATTSTESVKEGSVVKAIFLEYWVKSNAAAGEETKFQFVLYKAPTGVASITFAEMNNLQAYPNKKNILFYSQGVLGDLTSNSMPIVRNYFKVPKGKQRFGFADRLLLAISATGAGINTCGFATYKEYT